MFPSPALPWEIIERVANHSAGRTRTLYSFTLTCRQLRPGSTILLLRRVELKNRGQLLDLCAMLQAKTHLQPCVRSVSIPFDEFSPYPLLRMLPHLSEIEFGCPLRSIHILLHNLQSTGFLLHLSVLHCCHQLGKHIQTLSFGSINFRSLSDFSAILLSFPKIQSLSCSDLRSNNSDDRGMARHRLITRLSGRLHLRTLTIEDDSDAILTLLIQAAKHRLATLTYTTSNFDTKHFDTLLLEAPSDLVQLTSLTWKVDLIVAANLDGFKSSIQRIIRVLKDFRPPNLREVTVVLRYSSLRGLVVATLLSVTELCAELYAELEKTLITFSAPSILFSPDSERNIRNSRRYHSWMRLLGRCFPVLAEHRALRMDGELSGNAGHDGRVSTPIIISTNSRWAATGSDDGTIIIWDLETRCISHEWFVENAEVDSLAFSPDSRYIMSVSCDNTRRGWKATIWDLDTSEGGRKARFESLMGEGGNFISYSNIRCAWSPDGSWIAAGPQADGATHIWETTTFQRLHTTLKGGLLAVSSDGHWVATGAVEGVGAKYDCWIWNVGSGELHQSLVSHIYRVVAAAFDQEGIHVVTGSFDHTIRIWDLESGGQLLVLKEDGMKRGIHLAAFHGGMVLSHSDSENGEAAVWDASSGALLASLSQPYTYFNSTPDSSCFSPCGNYIASASYAGEEALLWRTSDWSCIARVSQAGGRALVTRVAISPDGKMLCLGTEIGTVFFRYMHDLIPANRD